MSKAIKTIEDLTEFYDAFTKVYGEGIFVKSDTHPCGWDWIDLTSFNDIYDMMEEPLCILDISNGIYNYHHFEGYTPFSLLKEIRENWCFERNAINWV